MRLFVCLSVCLLATLRTERIFVKNFTADVSLEKEELIKFRKLPASESGSKNLLKDLSILRDAICFHNLAHISRTTERIFMKILSQMYP